MRILIVFVFLLMSSCSEPDRKTEIIEKTVLWQGIAEKRWGDGGARGTLTDKELFTKQKNFYKPKHHIEAFGHKVQYVGLMGYQWMAGPNVLLEGSVDSVVRSIEGKYNFGLKKSAAGAYTHQVHGEFWLLVAQVPLKEGAPFEQTLVMGWYKGT